MDSRHSSKTEHGSRPRLRYEISLAARTRGLLLAVYHDRKRVPARLYRGKQCWEFRTEGAGPCAGCPLFGGADDAKQAFAVLQSDSASYVLLEIRRRVGRAEVQILPLSESEVSALCKEKLRKLSTRARLSAQESRVLELMSGGLQAKEMATALGLSARTVKFHGANLLRKLQIDSRLDILRIMTSQVHTLGPEPDGESDPRSTA